jgi:hypothetical protein
MTDDGTKDNHRLLTSAEYALVMSKGQSSTIVGSTPSKECSMIFLHS